MNTSALKAFICSFLPRMLLLVLFCSGTTTVKAELVLHYNFDEANGEALDLGVAPAANGIFTGEAGRTNNTPSGSGFALDVVGGNNAVNNYVVAGNPDKLNNLTNGITLTWWMYLHALPLASDRILEKLSSSAGFGVRFGTPNASAGTTTITLGVNTTGGTVASPVITSLNTWIFCAVSYDGVNQSQNVRFYLGSQTSPAYSAGPITSARGQILNTPNALRIGSTPATSADRTPPAWFDDVRVYNHILTASEVEEIRLANGGTVPKAPVLLSFQSDRGGYMELGATANLTATIMGEPPLTAAWLRNGKPIDGGTFISSSNLFSISHVVDNIVPDTAGFYSLIATNASGSVTSAPASLFVTTIYNSELLTNVWTLDPVYFYLTNNNAERGMAYSAVSASYPSSGSLLVPHYVNLTDFGIAVLNAEDGSYDGYFLPASDGGSVNVNSGTRAINMIGAADDGVIYVGNLTTSTTNTSGPYYLYRYASDSPSALPAIAFSGDPGGAAYPGLRWGDSLAVRGAGTSTEVLIAPAGDFGAFQTWQTNIVVLLKTTDGSTFTPNVIWITNGPTAFANNGLAFGPGTNTFFAKQINAPLRLMEFDVDSGLGWVKKEYDLNVVPGSATAIALSPDGTKLGVLQVETPDNFSYYSLTDFMAEPVLLDQEVFTLNNPNPNAGGVGSVQFGKNGRIYVLDSANGIKAFAPNAAYTPPAAFSLTSVQPNEKGVVLSWQTEAGRAYRPIASDSLTDGNWFQVGIPIVGDGSVMSVTNILLSEPPNRFYRVRAQ